MEQQRVQQKRIRWVVVSIAVVTSAFAAGLLVGRSFAPPALRQVVFGESDAQATAALPEIPGGIIVDSRQVQDEIPAFLMTKRATSPPEDFNALIAQRVAMYFTDDTEIARLSKTIIETAQTVAEGSFEQWKSMLDRQGRSLPTAPAPEVELRAQWTSGQQLLRGGELRLHSTRVYLRRQRGVSVHTPVDYFDSPIFYETFRNMQEQAIFDDKNVTLVDVTVGVTFSDTTAATINQPGRLIFTLAKRPTDGEWIVSRIGLTGVLDRIDDNIPIF